MAATLLGKISNPLKVLISRNAVKPFLWNFALPAASVCGYSALDYRKKSNVIVPSRKCVDQTRLVSFTTRLNNRPENIEGKQMKMKRKMKEKLGKVKEMVSYRERRGGVREGGGGVLFGS